MEVQGEAQGDEAQHAPRAITALVAPGTRGFITLRVRHPQGQVTLENLEPSMSLAALYDEIALMLAFGPGIPFRGEIIIIGEGVEVWLWLLLERLVVAPFIPRLTNSLRIHYFARPAPTGELSLEVMSGPPFQELSKDPTVPIARVLQDRATVVVERIAPRATAVHTAPPATATASPQRTSAPATGATRKPKAPSVITSMIQDAMQTADGPPDIHQTTDSLGSLMVMAAEARFTDLEPTLRSFKKDLKTALRAREEDATAENRFAAALAGDYEFLDPQVWRLAVARRGSEC